MGTFRLLVALLGTIVLCGAPALGAGREFRPGSIRQTGDLPPSRLRDRLQSLPEAARNRAIAWLGNFHFPEADLPNLEADAEGGIFYVDEFHLAPTDAAPAETEPPTAAASVPISPFPANLIFHSRPGAPNVIYLNFTGETVTGTAWNTSLNRNNIPAVAFSTDGDATTFSDSEQLAIKRIWQRVAEDYAPFNVDVTTQRPATFTTRTAHALITRNTDANGAVNPASTAGGVAYVGVFANSSYANYRPAWIYLNNLANEESFIAEAVSHEVGHNLGLSHDGRTDGQDYYGGHGSGETSWGPIMGTGYNRNVSQWSKGEYYLANNTQDDLATIAGKLTYRTDDHGNTLATARPLVISAGGTVAATTPETDPTNLTPANKGVIEQNTDVDWFSFASGSGPLNLTINPWIVPNATYRGGNVDLLIELYDASGNLLLTNNASTRTVGVVQTNLLEGIYYIAIRPTGLGTPLATSPSGYTVYGSLGQYFISGTVIPSGVVIPPGAELAVTDITQAGVTSQQLRVTYTDNVAIDVSSIDSSDLQVNTPAGSTLAATLVSIDQPSNGTPRVATYSITPAGGAWTELQNGLYTVTIQANQVRDTENAAVPSRELGQFTVAVPRVLYAQRFDSNPAWTFEGLWQYGLPTDPAGPSSGYTGANIVAYNLAGNYENRLSLAYATTPIINCSGASTLTLRFRRWLRLRNGDTANIQISVNSGAWTDIWSTTRSVTDNSWQEIQYSLPAAAAGSSNVRLRWGMASNNSQNDIGWNIDDVEIFGNGALDTIAPTATLIAQNLVTAGSPLHTLAVTFNDNTGIKVASLDDNDLYVLGPNNYSNVVTFAGVDIPTDGFPRSASYSLAAAAETWTAADNGDYQVYLRAGEITDTSNNTLDETLLGSFTVAIPATRNLLIVDRVNFSIIEGGQGTFAVKLSEAPLALTTVTVERISGDADLTLADNLPLIFTPLAWDTPIPVLINALADPDRENGSATFELRGDGITPVSIFVTESDTTPLDQRPQISTFAFAAGTLDLTATATPGANITLLTSSNLIDWAVASTQPAPSGAASFHLTDLPPTAAFFTIRAE